jgi:hypothetical protein
VFQPEGFRDASAVCRIGTHAIDDVALLDVQLGIAHCARRVLEQHLALSRVHLPEQVTRLLPVIIVDAMIELRANMGVCLIAYAVIEPACSADVWNSFSALLSIARVAGLTRARRILG